MRSVQAGKRIALKNILFATDFSSFSNSALPFALAIAFRYAAKLYVVHVMPTKAEMVLLAPETWPMRAEEDDRRVRTYFKELGNQLQDLPHEVLMPRGKVAAALAQVIEENSIDLLVVGTHGRSGVGKLLLGSVAEDVFRRAGCAVLSVGPHISSKPGSEIHFQRVLFATDFSENSLSALPYALSFAEEDEAHLTLLHVVEQPAAGISKVEDLRAALMLRLRELVPIESEPWCQPECVLEFGNQFAPPSVRILEVAKAQATDLIVLGIRSVEGKWGMTTHLASTTAQILTQAACPVLTVRGGSA